MRPATGWAKPVLSWSSAAPSESAKTLPPDGERGPVERTCQPQHVRGYFVTFAGGVSGDPGRPTARTGGWNLPDRNRVLLHMTGLWAEAALPALALLLFVCCGAELAMRGFRGRSVLRSRRGPARRPLTGSAFDEFGLMFNGNKSIEIEQQQQDEGRREEEGDGAPPRTRIDLASGTARIVLLPESGRGHGPQKEPPA